MSGYLLDALIPDLSPRYGRTHKGFMKYFIALLLCARSTETAKMWFPPGSLCHYPAITRHWCLDLDHHKTWRSWREQGGHPGTWPLDAVDFGLLCSHHLQAGFPSTQLCFLTGWMVPNTDSCGEASLIEQEKDIEYGHRSSSSTSALRTGGRAGSCQRPALPLRTLVWPAHLHALLLCLASFVISVFSLPGTVLGSYPL